MKSTLTYAKLKMYACFFALLICTSIFSCKKKDVPPPPSHIYFVVLDKNGNSIVHSVKDSLKVTFTSNGVAVSDPLHVYKVETSATDTSTVSKFGYVISDRDFSAELQGYMTVASAGGDSQPVRNFNLFLNGKSIGAIYFDYYSFGKSSLGESVQSFSLNGNPGKIDSLIGVYNDGDGIAANIEYNHTSPGESAVTVLRVQ
jgi:hypothetical protein